MIEDYDVLCHNAIRLVVDGKVIYIDPFGLEKEYNDADYICITHSHYDHFSPDDILKVKKEDSIILITEDIFVNTLKLGFRENRIVIVEPNNKYNIEGLLVETVRAYNNDKAFHPRENDWVGYIFTFKTSRVYVAGDTDDTEEAYSVICDLAFVPIGGTYTMDYAQAARLINSIRPAIVVPTHYGKIVGSSEDAKNFKCLLNSNIVCEIKI